MFFSSIEEGDIVEIKYQPGQDGTLEDGNLTDEAFMSKIYGIYDNRTVDIIMPFKDGAMVVLQNEREYSVVVSNKKNFYHFNGRSVGRRKTGNFALITLQVEGEVEKLQRRESFRMDVTLDVGIRKADEKTAMNMYKSEAGGKFINKFGVTLNISAGGVKFISDEEFEKSDIIFMELVFPNPFEEDGSGIAFNPRRDGGMSERAGNKDTFLYCLFTVVECVKNNRGYFETRGYFSEIDKKDREKIVRYVFWLERRLRKKEVEENV